MVNLKEIDAAVSAREAQIEKLRYELEIAQAELRGMKSLRDQILGQTISSPSPGQPKIIEPFNTVGSNTVALNQSKIIGHRGGRQTGAISRTWRLILSDMEHNFKSGWFSENHLIPIASKHGIELRVKEARNRMAALSAHNYVQQDPKTGNWRVTEYAAKKFGFFEKRLEENEAPTEESEGAS